MSFDHEQFKNVLSGIQSFAVVIAIFVGGVWTLYIFSTLAQVDKARAELEVLEVRLREQAVIDVHIEPSQIAVPGNAGRFVHAVVNIKNIGNRNAVITFGEYVFTATPIGFDENKKPTLGPWTATVVLEVPPYDPDPIVDEGLLRTGASFQLPFIVGVEEPGLYLLGFRVDVSAPELEVYREYLPEVEGKTVSWSARAFFVVR